jgi:hypothetical protein
MGLYDTFIKRLEKLKVNISDCRGQTNLKRKPHAEETPGNAGHKQVNPV